MADPLPRSRPPLEPEDIVAMYLDCHARIRAFTELASGLARAPAAPAALIISTAERIHRYFTEELPLHFRDEEESLARRLRGTDPAVDRALDWMEAQHREHDEVIAQLVERCAALIRNPAHLPAQAWLIAALSANLSTLLEDHLALEERVLFPAVPRLISAEGRAAMIRELRERRAAAAH